MPRPLSSTYKHSHPWTYTVLILHWQANSPLSPCLTYTDRHAHTLLFLIFNSHGTHSFFPLHKLTRIDPPRGYNSVQHANAFKRDSAKGHECVSAPVCVCVCMHSEMVSKVFCLCSVFQHIFIDLMLCFLGWHAIESVKEDGRWEHLTKPEELQDLLTRVLSSNVTYSKNGWNVDHKIKLSMEAPNLGPQT